MEKEHKLVVVIPAYNEEKNIVGVIEKSLKYTQNIIVVNDCSTDNTAEVARTKGVAVVNLLQNRGAGYATRVGCDEAIKQGADIIVTLDADGQHCPDDMPGLLREMRAKNADMVFGYRLKDKNMPLIKKIGNKTLSLTHHVLFGIYLQDSLTGFHAFRACSFDKIRWKSDRYGFISEFVYIIYKNKLTFGEALVKTIYLDKKKGMTVKDGIKSIMLLIIWKFGLSDKWIRLFNLN